MILAGDAGGTKTRLALYTLENGTLVRKAIEKFSSKESPTLEGILQPFLNKHKVDVKAACIGVPGPVVDGTARTTNLPWKLSEHDLSHTTKIPHVKLVNDLVSTTAAVPHLSADKLLTLHSGKPGADSSVRAVLAPGTGLGQAFLHAVDGENYVLGSEGGHIEFAPSSDLEIDLLKYLKRTYEHVSVERVLCGPGLVNIYNFLKDSGFAAEPKELRERMGKEDPAAVISITGLAGEYELTRKALDVFASLLGAQAGNVALTYLASGGVYLGGGIPPKISRKLLEGPTLKAYISKGRLSDFVKATPLYVIQDDEASVIGAAHLAAQLLRKK